jgi:hypothetical protein
MQITENYELSRIMLNHLSDKYNLHVKRTGTHLSSLIYCLTKQQFDQVDPLPPTDEEVMLFALGYGLQYEFTPPEGEEGLIEKDGLIYRPDFILKLPGFELCEMKTTRQSAKKGDNHQFPEGWLKYMMGGCFIQDKNFYDLAVLYMVGYWKPPAPVIKSFRFEFEDDELMDNWSWLCSRRVIFESAINSGQMIAPYSQCEPWECNNCRYKLICQTISGSSPEVEESNGE